MIARIAFLLACLLLLSDGILFSDWPMPGANPQRTSWSAEEVPGRLIPAWYRPIEPYISQNVQIVAAGELIYVSTARGLWALRADSGDVAWVYPTALPLGHSPTIHEGVAYVGGFDHLLHAVNAATGQRLWTFAGAAAGYSSNPLVVDGRILIGNRDGGFYAISAQGTSTPGRLEWKFQAGGPILFSPAYKDGIVFFAANDMHAYALEAATGRQVWKSAKLPGEGFDSWWPVIWGDYVVFAGSHPAYRVSARPGTQSIPERRDAGDFNKRVEAIEVFAGQTSSYLGERGTQPGSWAAGTSTLDAGRILDYLQKNPQRRTLFVLERRTGQEFTFVHNSGPGYAPFLYTGTQNGQRYPAIVGPDGVLYAYNKYWVDSHPVYRGQVTGWTLGSRYISLVSGAKTNAVDEPLAASGGGQLIYWSLCCDRESGAFRITPGSEQWQYVNYNLGQQAPGYDQMWAAVGDQDGTGNRLWGAYGSNNGIYHNHGNAQNPFVPHLGKVFIHRSNAVIAFALRGNRSRLPLSNMVPQGPEPPSESRHRQQLAGELILLERSRQRLVDEVSKMVAAGHLRPGYFNGGQWWSRPPWGDRLNDYFAFPGDTLWALLRALPHLPSELQSRVRDYLQAEFTAFPPGRFAHIGWCDGAAREAFDLPPEVQTDLANFPPSTSSDCQLWSFPPHAFYALWKYAEVFGGAAEILQDARSRLPTPPSDDSLREFCHIHNAFIAGYMGYLNLERLASLPESAGVRRELDRLLQLRADSFSVDTPWTFTDRGSHIKRMSVFRNFLYLTPELADYLREHARERVEAALAETERVAPFWFVTRYEGCLQECTTQNLNDYNAVFEARAWILREPRGQLARYLDVPAFAVGDLFYIHQLVSLLEAR